MLRIARQVKLSPALSRELTEAIAYQLGNHIDREGYDAQVSAYQSRYANVRDAITAAPLFERVE